MMREVVCGSLALVGCVWGVAALLAAGPKEPPLRGAAGQEAKAAEHLRRGLEYKEEAREWFEAAGRRPEGRGEELRARARDRYLRAADEARRALEAMPESPEAYNLLGYALRQSGSVAEALAAYDRALELSPGYAEALEYRGEAYLALDRPLEARAAFEALEAAGDAAEAADLLEEIQAWMDAHPEPPLGVSEEDLEDIRDWLASLARQG